MENLHIGNIAIATVIIGILDLIIVILVRTETILKAVERIKGVIRLDYKSRAKRSDDEIRLFKKHEMVARERVRHSFISMEKWGCKWVWNWSKEFEPINIKGYCTATMYVGGDIDNKCMNPVQGIFSYPYGEDSTGMVVGILCSNNKTRYDHPIRKQFSIFRPDVPVIAEVAMNEIVAKVVITERDLQISKEIKKMNWQFWK